MPAYKVVLGQRVEESKVERAKQLRREMTPQERVLWQHLRGNKLGGLHFRRQQLIDGFIVDFYCHAVGLVVEVDGPVHEQRKGYDEERDLTLQARGLRILRLHNEEITNDLPSVLRRILAACEGGT